MTSLLTIELSELVALKRMVRREPYRVSANRVQAGNQLSRFRGRGMDFAETRHYQAGDEVRHMEWRVTARTGRPHIKLYQEERERPVIIVTDFSPSMYFGTRGSLKTVVASKVAGLIAWTAVNQQDKVGALLYGEDNFFSEFTPRSRDAGILPMLAALSHQSKQLTNKDKTSNSDTFIKALTRVHRVARHGSIVVLISDFYQLTADINKHIRQLRAHSDVLAYHIVDALEVTPPPPGNYAITDGLVQYGINTESKKTQQIYQQWCTKRHLAVSDLCKSLQVQHCFVEAKDNLAKLIARTFPRRSRDSF